MAMSKRDILAWADSLPDDENVEEKAEEISSEPEEKPSEESEPSQSTIEASVTEDVEVNAPPVEEINKVIVTADQMVEESLDMRFATFESRIKEQENALKIALAEINTLKGHFSTIEKAIDATAEASPTGANFADLINML